MIEEGFAAFPKDPDMGPLNGPELLVALYLRMYGMLGKCDGAPLECIEEFLADTYALGMRCLKDRGLIVPYEPSRDDRLGVAWDAEAFRALTDDAMMDFVRTGFVRGLAEDDSR